MKLLSPPFASDTHAMLYNILLGGEALFYESISVNYGAISKLNFINNPAADPTLLSHIKYAQIMLEADATQVNNQKVLRFVEVPELALNGGIFSVAQLRGGGLPLGNIGLYEVKGVQNMKNWRCTGVESSKSHIIRVQYYG